MQQQYDTRRLSQQRSMTGGVESRVQYDAAGRPISQLVEVQGRGRQLSRSYDWASSGRLMQTLDRVSNHSVKYDYDIFDNLFGAQYADGGAQLKNPDETGNLFGNRQRSDRVYDQGGKLLRDKDWYYAYDALGNLVLKSKRAIHALQAPSEFTRKKKPSIWDADYRPSPYNKTELDELSYEENDGGQQPAVWQAGDWSYSWYANGMLEEIRRPDGELIRFEYDALGRRSAKIAAKQITRYIWDGNVLLHEWQYALADRPGVAVDESIISNYLGTLVQAGYY